MVLQNYGLLFIIEPETTLIQYCSSTVPSFFQMQPEQVWKQRLLNWIHEADKQAFLSTLKTITYQKTIPDGKNPYPFRTQLLVDGRDEAILCGAALHWTQAAGEEQWLAVIELKPLHPVFLVQDKLTLLPAPETNPVVDIQVGQQLFYLPHGDTEFYLNPARTAAFFREFERMLSCCTTMSLLTEMVPRAFRMVFGYEQGLLYQFGNDMSTKVIGTDTDPQSIFTETYKDFKFPKTTIPMEVWQKYVLQANRVRVLFDRCEPGVQLISSPQRQDQAVNFSRAELVRNSEVHLEFLKAMNVRGQLSLNILIEDKLWAVLSIHTAVPRRQVFEARHTICRMGSLVSQQIAVLQNQERIADFEKLAIRPVATRSNLEHGALQDYIHKPNRIRPLVGSLVFDWKTLAANAADYLAESLGEILSSFGADACGVLIDDAHRIRCTEPDLESECLTIMTFLRDSKLLSTFSTNDTKRYFPDSSVFSRIFGILYLPLSKTGDTFVVLLRKEHIEHVVWNTDPSGNYESGDVKSYPAGKWEEEVRGTSKEWNADDTQKAQFVHSIYQRFVDVYKEKQSSAVDLRNRMTLIDGVAAEIRDALYRISMAFSECKSTIERPSLLKYAVYGDEACKSLLNIVSDFAYLSRVEAGDVIIREEEFSIQKMILSVGSLFEIPCQQRGLSWHLQIDPRLEGLVVSGDPTRLRQIICNLCGNAIKFTEAGHILLRVELARKLEPNDGQIHLLFEIADTGIGIPKESISRLFNQFERVENSHKTKHRAEGTGLGLAIVSRLIEALQGTLAVQTVENEGSKFQFTLTYPIISRNGNLKNVDGTSKDPIIDAIVANLSKKMDVTNEDISGQNAPQKNASALTVLVAEDNLVNQKILKKRLEVAGHKVLVASNGKECIDLFFKSPASFDLILMDVKMPLMSGVEAAESIRSKNYSVPIIGVSADIDYDACRGAGMSGYISKPVDYAFLKEMLKEVRYETTEKRLRLDANRNECKGWF